MAGRKGKKTNRQATNDKPKETQFEGKSLTSMEQEVQRQSVAARATRDVEIEQLMTALRLLASYFNEEQLSTPVLQFFKEKFPNLSLQRNEENKKFEVQWKSECGKLPPEFADGRDVNASLLHRLSVAYSHMLPSFGGVDFSTEAARANLFGDDNVQFKDSVFEGSAYSQMLGMQDALRTPGVSSQRLSVGMTPKTQRVPKAGEILLSVHGSPLGVFKENNMGAIHESEED